MSPETRTSPPSRPAPGPMSTMWSARRMVSSSCSTTRTVFPRSRRAPSVCSSFAVVARVEADAGFVEHVEDADEAAPDLGGEADALGFAAREGAGGARQREVAEPHVVEELEPLDDLLEDGDADLGRLAAGGAGVVEPAAEERAEFGHGLRGDGGEGEPLQRDGPALGAQPAAFAGETGGEGHVLLEREAHALARRLVVAAQGGGDGSLPADIGVAVEDRLLLIRVQLAPDGVEVEVELAGEAREGVAAGAVTRRPQGKEDASRMEMRSPPR